MYVSRALPLLSAPHPVHLFTTMSRATPLKSWPVRSDCAATKRLSDFLLRSKARLQAGQKHGTPGTHIVLGNESADMDSVVCAIAYAYNDQETGMDLTAVVNCPRGDLALRGDVDAILSSAGIDVNELVFIDEIDIESFQGQVTLVDHNTLAATQKSLASRVCGIIDHHADSRDHLEVSPRVIEPVGSCSTLILETSELLREKHSTNRTLSTMLLSAILLDTMNMDKAAGRGTDKDGAAVEKLIEIVGIDHSTATALYEELGGRKSAQDHLSTRDLLRRDFKLFVAGSTRIGIASVGISLSRWAARQPGHEFGLLGSSLREFASDRNLDVLVVMTSWKDNDGNFKRELAIVARDDTAKRTSCAKYVIPTDQARNPLSSCSPQKLVSLRSCLYEHSLTLPSLHALLFYKIRSFLRTGALNERLQVQPVTSIFVASMSKGYQTHRSLAFLRETSSHLGKLSRP